MRRTPVAITLPELADLLGLRPDGLRLLRHFASPEAGILRPAAVVDGRGTKIFAELEWLRACVALALVKQGQTVSRIRDALDTAERGRYGSAKAFQGVLGGRSMQFRILAYRDGRSAAGYAESVSPVAEDVESCLSVELGGVWQPLLPRKEAE